MSVHTDTHTEGSLSGETRIGQLETDLQQQLGVILCPSELFLKGTCSWGFKCVGHGFFCQITEIASGKTAWREARKGEPEIS